MEGLFYLIARAISYGMPGVPFLFNESLTPARSEKERELQREQESGRQE